LLLDNDIYDAATAIENDAILLPPLFTLSWLRPCAGALRGELRGGQERRRAHVHGQRRPAISPRQSRHRIRDSITVDAATLRHYLRRKAATLTTPMPWIKPVDALFAIELAKSGETSSPASKRAPNACRPSTTRHAGARRGWDHQPRLHRRGRETRLRRAHRNPRQHENCTMTWIRREFDFGEGDAYNRALIDRAERRLKARLLSVGKIRHATGLGAGPGRRRCHGRGTGHGRYSRIAGGLFHVRRDVGPGQHQRIGNFLGTGDVVRAKVTYGEIARGFELGFTDPLFSTGGFPLASVCSARRPSPQQSVL